MVRSAARCPSCCTHVHLRLIAVPDLRDVPKPDGGAVDDADGQVVELVEHFRGWELTSTSYSVAPDLRRAAGKDQALGAERVHDIPRLEVLCSAREDRGPPIPGGFCRHGGQGTWAPSTVDNPTRTWFCPRSYSSCSESVVEPRLYCRIGTVEVLYRITSGGVWPGASGAGWFAQWQ